MLLNSWNYCKFNIVPHLTWDSQCYTDINTLFLKTLLKSVDGLWWNNRVNHFQENFPILLLHNFWNYRKFNVVPHPTWDSQCYTDINTLFLKILLKSVDGLRWNNRVNHFQENFP